jgi:glycosyltransferase involved in cell wall biosynthesis
LVRDLRYSEASLQAEEWIALKIGFISDAITSKMAGIGRYSKNIFKHLVRADENVVSVDWRQRDELERYLQVSPAHHCMIVNRWPVMKSLLWHAFLLKKLKSCAAQFDVLFSPSQFLHVLGRPTVPFVYVVHDVSFMSFPECHKRGRKLLFQMFFQQTLKKADHIICDSKYSRDELLKYFDVEEKRLSVIYAACDTSFVPIDEPKALEKVRHDYALPERFVLYLGTIEPRKNLENLFLAYHLFRDKLSLPLFVAGRVGWRSQPIFELHKRYGLDSMVKFLGYVPDKDLPMLLNLATALVYVSKDEGFGLPPLEAMQCGVPVIVSNGGSLPEIVADAGYMVPHDDPAAIAGAIMQVGSDRRLREELREKGLKRSAEFSWDVTVQQLRQLFNRIVSES